LSWYRIKLQCWYRVFESSYDVDIKYLGRIRKLISIFDLTISLKLKLKIKNTLTTSFFTLAKKLANKTFLFIVVFFDFNVDSIVNNNKFFDNNANNKTSINATIVTKISLNKKDKFIINKIASCRERRLSNKKFETIQKKKKIKKNKKNKLLVLKNYTLIYIVVFDNSTLFE